MGVPFHHRTCLYSLTFCSSILIGSSDASGNCKRIPNSNFCAAQSANWRALSIVTKFLAFTDTSTCTCCQELDGHWTCKKRLLLLYSYCNLFVLGFMAKKEPMPFMQFISPYLVIIADQRFFLAKMKNPPHRERGATKLDRVLV
jgi:hypothetical protein